MPTVADRLRTRRKPSSLEKLSATIVRNAHRYRTVTACRLAIARVRSAWTRRGGYGCEKQYVDAAVEALGDRLHFLAFASPREAAETPEDRQRLADSTDRVLQLAEIYRRKFPRWF